MNTKMEGVAYENLIAPSIGKTFKIIEDYGILMLKQAKVGISKHQWVVLNIIYSKEGINLKKIAEITNRDKTSVTRLISKLEKKEFLEKRISSKDKRVSELHITKKGLSKIREVAPIINKIVLNIQDALNQEEINNTLKTLNKIQNKLKTLK